MHRIGVGVDETYRYRLDIQVTQVIHFTASLITVQRFQHLTVCVDSLVHRHPQIAFDQWRWLLPGEIVKTRHAKVADFEDVSKALGAD